jgi:glycosyltransferase involved in cell wall biosynthesis
VVVASADLARVEWSSVHSGRRSSRSPHRTLLPAPRPSSHRPRRILHVEANEDGTVGGSHRGLVDLVTSVDRSRFEPVVLFYQENRHVAALRAAGVETHCWDDVRRAEREVRVRGGVSKYLDYAGAVRRRTHLLKALRIELIHLNNSPVVSYDDWLPAARIAGVPCITFAMGDAVMRSAVQRFAARRFDHIITISRYMHEAVRAVGVREDRMTLAYLGVDAQALRAAVTTPRAAVRAELAVDPDDVLVVMVGNIRSWKGQSVVVEALALLPDQIRRRVQMRFVGAESALDAEYRRSLDARISACDLADRVRFLGPRNDVPALYAAADLALHASIIPEPFGLVVPEAMVHGTPVIASRFGGPGEVITPACGRLFDPSHPAELAAHLIEMVANPDLRRALGQEAARRVEAFSVRAMVQTIEGVYARLL